MKQIISEWSEFCEKNIDFEDSHFYTLFMENINSEEINEIYKYFPNSEKLIERMNKYLFEQKPKIENFEEKKNELEKLIKFDFEDRMPIFRQMNTFSLLKINPSFSFTPNTEIVSKLILDDIWSQEFQDFFTDKKIINDRKVFELKNALYGITYDFDYQLYLFEPLLNTNYSGEHLFKFKQLGGVYAITDNGIYFSFKNDN